MVYKVETGQGVSEGKGDNPQTSRSQLAEKITKLRLTRVPSKRHLLRKKNKSK
jgi:hypothetical protein